MEYRRRKRTVSRRIKTYIGIKMNWKNKILAPKTFKVGAKVKVIRSVGNPLPEEFSIGDILTIRSLWTKDSKVEVDGVWIRSTLWLVEESDETGFYELELEVV